MGISDSAFILVAYGRSITFTAMVAIFMLAVLIDLLWKRIRGAAPSLPAAASRETVADGHSVLSPSSMSLRRIRFSDGQEWLRSESQWQLSWLSRPGATVRAEMVHKIGADLRLRILTGRLQGVDASDTPVADYGSVPRDGGNPALTPGYALPPGIDTPEGSEPAASFGRGWIAFAHWTQ